MHPLEDPRDPLKTQYNPLETLLGPPDFGLRDLWLSKSYHPRSDDTVRVELSLHHGNLCLSQGAARTKACAATKGKGGRLRPGRRSSDLDFQFEEERCSLRAPVSSLPRKALLHCQVRLRRRNQDGEGGEELVLAWGNLRLFDHRGRMLSGLRKLCLWPEDCTSAGFEQRCTPHRPSARTLALNDHHANPIELTILVPHPRSGPLRGG